MNKTQKNIWWALRILLSLGFLAASLGKLTQNPAVLDMFAQWGYSPTFALIIGALELMLGVLLLVSKTSFYAAIGLLGLMAGAAVTHIMHDSMGELLRPAIFSLLLAGVVYLEKRNS